LKLWDILRALNIVVCTNPSLGFFFRNFRILHASFMVEEPYLVFYQLYFNNENDETALKLGLTH